MKSIFASLLLFLFGGCASKVCGVDEEIFKNFNKVQQAVICKKYVEHQKRIEEYNAKRALLEEQNHKKMLENESIKLKALYAKAYNCDRYDGFAPVKLLVSFKGAAGYSKKKFKPLYPKVIRIVEGEAKRVCLQTARRRFSDKHCFWIALYEGNLYINIDPARGKSWMKRYVIEGDIDTNRDTVVLPIDSVVATTVEFYADGNYFRLTVKLRPNFAQRF
ncbi:hypothetical protein [Nitratiruptor sp. YY09-18]|uniref:hypothetical protein n=1 Tax=Nitratiruptor sp. YY09-18 TaxID=2724901 RepID=UPI0019169D01|nr:hypothetical protein [Nitratiruptor sp. YY09-18]